MVGAQHVELNNSINELFTSYRRELCLVWAVDKSIIVVCGDQEWYTKLSNKWAEHWSDFSPPQQPDLHFQTAGFPPKQHVRDLNERDGIRHLHKTCVGLSKICRAVSTCHTQRQLEAAIESGHTRWWGNAWSAWIVQAVRISVNWWICLQNSSHNQITEVLRIWVLVPLIWRTGHDRYDPNLVQFPALRPAARSASLDHTRMNHTGPLL